MSNVCRHTIALVDATKAYAKATSSSVILLIVENNRMAKELQAAKKGEEKATTSFKLELKKVIRDEVSSQSIIMWKLYFKFVLVHKPVVYLNGWQ